MQQYEENVIKVNTSLEGLILKELPEHLKHAFLQSETAKPVIISAGMTELEEQIAGDSQKIQESNSLVYR